MPFLQNIYCDLVKPDLEILEVEITARIREAVSLLYFMTEQ